MHNHGRGRAYRAGCEGCKKLNSPAQLAYYRKNPDKLRANHRQTRKKRKAWIDVIKLERKCIDCGFDAAAEALDFDHVRGVKLASINQMVRQGYSKKAILEEMAKCEIVCANCHRIRTKRRYK